MTELLLKDYIREVADFPQEGVIFKDLSPLFMAPESYTYFLKKLSNSFPDFDVILGIESRGFLIASSLSLLLNKPMMLVRKKGKLPPPVESESYQLEYGQDTLEILSEIKGGKKCIIVDDVLATGGTLTTAIKLAQKVQLEVVMTATLIDLAFLREGWRQDIPHSSLLIEK